MLCNISGSLFETLQPRLIQTLHSQLVTVKKKRPGFWPGRLTNMLL